MGYLSSTCSILLLLSLASASEIYGHDYARKVIDSAEREALVRLRNSLPNADASVLRQPLHDIKLLAEAGREDVELIANYTGPGDKTEAFGTSAMFWKDKIDACIKPFVDNKEMYKDLIISNEFPLPDPIYEDEEARQFADKHVNQKVQKAIESLKNDVNRLKEEKPRKVEDITKISYKRFVIKSGLDAAIDSIKRQGQLSKHDLVSGRTMKGLEWLQRTIDSAYGQFWSNVQELRTNV